MPTAQPFRFYGSTSSSLLSGEMFTGFPRTIAVDVSGYDWWITLGGCQKGQTPTPEQIEQSLLNAGKAYWRAYSLTVEGTSTLIQPPWYNLSAAGPVTATSGEPVLRCDIEQVGWSDEVRDDASGDPDIPGPAVLVGSALLPSRYVVRMFDGEVFVGYGLQQLARVWAMASDDSFDIVNVDRRYVSYGNTPPTGYEPIDDYMFEGNAQYTTLGGLPVVELYATGYPAGTHYSVATVDAPTLDFWDVPA